MFEAQESEEAGLHHFTIPLTFSTNVSLVLKCCVRAKINLCRFGFGCRPLLFSHFGDTFISCNATSE